MSCLSWHGRLKHNEIQCKNKYRLSLGGFCQYWVRGRPSNQYKFKYSKNASGCFNPKFIPSVISSMAASWPYHLSIIEMLRLLTLCEFILIGAKDMDMYLHISPVFQFSQCFWCTNCSLDEFLEDCISLFHPLTAYVKFFTSTLSHYFISFVNGPTLLCAWTHNCLVLIQALFSLPSTIIASLGRLLLKWRKVSFHFNLFSWLLCNKRCYWLFNTKWSALRTYVQSNIIKTEQVLLTYLEKEIYCR